MTEPQAAPRQGVNATFLANGRHLVHVITGLDVGGAELVLLRVVTALERDGFVNKVVSLTGTGGLRAQFNDLGVNVTSLNIHRRAPTPPDLWRLVRYLKTEQPDVVQTWMYHADLLGGVAARAAGIQNVVWNIRNGTLDRRRSKVSTRISAYLSGKVSRWIPRRIICCSESARMAHSRYGYDERKIVVINNGVDTRRFVPRSEVRGDVARELGLAENKSFVGVFGRFDPQKDHEMLIRAAAIAANCGVDAEYVMCGKGIDSTNEELMQILRKYDMESKFHLLGIRHDMPRLTSAMDICCSSSGYGEGFSNVIAEAMSCGVPCVATDIGEARTVIGNTGRICDAGDSEAFASLICDLLTMDSKHRKRLGREARERVVSGYSLEKMIDSYKRLYREM